MQDIVRTFNEKFPNSVPIICTLSLQYFVIQYIAAKAWPVSFSLRHNTISDLGNTACGMYSGRYVCSPDHLLMNLSFIALGATMTLSSILIYQDFQKSRILLLAFSIMGLGGFGAIIVGLFPENINPTYHLVGAATVLVCGPLSMFLLANNLNIASFFRLLTLLLSIFSFIALVLYVTHIYGPIGRGGMERAAAYPQTIWLILLGLYMTVKRHRSY